ncbi:MAG: hypothetical protein KatS3mg131_0113 [Candidatus Tectimicrobiota bacterium]|nr:MAG: hypothetical protein KatS3mg131_0113 [Candidatus Tectomicrobia bacterium]
MTSTTTADGLTLVETLLVVLLLGLAATLAVPALEGVLVERRLDDAAGWLVADLRYAQSLAIKTQQPHQVVFDAAGDSYSLTDQSGTVVLHPLTRQAYVVDFDAQRQFQGIDLQAAAFGGSSTLVFDALGAPQSGGTVILSYAGRQRVIAVRYPTGSIGVQ